MSSTDSVAFDLGGTKLLMHWKYQGKTYSEKIPTGATITTEQIKNACHDFIKRAPFTPKNVGIAVPGLVKDGELILADRRENMHGLSEDMLSTEETRFHMINDAKAAVYAEAEHYPKDTTLIVLVCGTGLGTGIKVNGTILDGVHGWSSECGHIPIHVVSKDENGMEKNEVIYADDLIGGAALLKAIGTDPVTFHSMIDSKDPKALAVVEKGGYYFGLVMANLINTFNPKYIVIGGSTSSYPGYLEKAKEVAEKYALPPNWSDVEFRDPFDLQNIVVDGAAAFAHRFD